MVRWRRNFLLSKKTNTCNEIYMDADLNKREPLRRILSRRGAILAAASIQALGRKKSGKYYRQEDINLLNTLANQGAIAIENARMLKQVIEKERMEEALSIAHDLQMSMLPEKCPEIEGVDMAAFSQPAREVGGDFFINRN